MNLIHFGDINIEGKIDSKKISSLANLRNEKIMPNEEIEEIIDQLKQQLLYGSNACFLFLDIEEQVK